jgi:hypothetical protein
LFFDLIFQDKAPYVARALKKKEEYEATIQAYNKKLVKTYTHFGV